MNKFSKEGFRFIVAIFIGFLTIIVSMSIINSGLRALSKSILETIPDPVEEEQIETPSYRVDFNVMGGVLTGDSYQNVTENKYIVHFPVAEKEGYVFLGWFTGVTPSDVLFTSSIPVVQDITLYAQYVLESTDVVVEPGVETYRVAFETNNGLPVDSIEVPKNSTFNLPYTTKESYVFLGWYTGQLPGDVLFTAQTIVTRDITLYARWERASYMLTFISNGGSFTAPIIAQADSTLTLPTNPRLLNHSFEGWFLDSDLTEPFSQDTMPTTNTTLYAKWVAGTDEGVDYVYSSTGATIVGFDGFHTEIIIPETKNGLPVVAIGEEAFMNANRLASLTFLGNDLVTIGKNAFLNAVLLKDFNLPTSVEIIKDNAFKNASSLEHFEIGSNIVSIGVGILQGADSLRNIEIPFYGTNAYIQPTNLRYYFGGSNYLSDATIPTSLSKVTVTENTTNIPNDAFRDIPTLKEVHLPASLISVGTGVLQGTNVETITWTFTGLTDGSVNSYLSYAFGNAYQAVTNVPSSLKVVNINEPADLTIHAYAFYNVGYLNIINLPDSVTTIKPYAFAHNVANVSKLSNIELPASLVSLGDYAFSNATQLGSLVIPNATTVGLNVLTGTTNLTDLTIGGNLTYFRYYFGGTNSTTGGTMPTNLKNVTIDSITGDVLPVNYFYGFTTIEHIELPNTITSIGNSAFYNTTSLISVNLENSIVSIGTTAFSNSGIKSVTIPASVTALSNDLFVGTTRLETVNLPNTLLTIGNNVFMNSTALKSLNIPSSVTSIGSGLIYGTTSLNSLVFSVDSLPSANRYLRYLYGGTSATAGGALPVALKTVTLNSNTVTQIPTSFFSGFTTIESVILSDGFTSMSTNVFYGATALKSVTLPSNLDSINNYAFYNNTNLASLELPDTVVNLGAYAFYGTTNLNSLALPADLVTLGTNAFQNSGLISVTLPDSVVSVPADAFNGATNLINVTLGNAVTSIGNNAFMGTKLASIQLPNTLTTLGNSVFQNATELLTLSIPSTVTSIGTNFLTGTTLLQTLTLTVDSMPASYRFLRYLYGGTTVSAGGVFPTALKTVNLNSIAVAAVPTSFFYLFGTIENVTLSNTFTTLGTSIFNGAAALNNVVLPNALTNIADSSFYNTTSLLTLTVPNTVTSVGITAFTNSAVKELKFEGTLTSIGSNAFQTTLLEKIYFYQTTLPTIGTTIFGTNTTVNVYVLADSVATFTANAQFNTINTAGRLLTFDPTLSV